MYLPSVREACREAGVDLFVFAGGALRAPFPFDYQMNSAYRYMRPENVDVLILLTATLKSWASPEVFQTFYDALNPLPLINISFPVGDHPGLVIDNKIGLGQAIRHLIEVHGRKRIAFIKGPEHNPEALQRYQTYVDTLRDCGLGFDPNLITPGDFTYRCGTMAVNILLDERAATFDAIVAANDDMALAAMQSLQQRGFRIPEDVAVVGFDDLSQSAYTSPALTTVRQPYAVQGKQAVALALDIIAGKEVPTILVSPTELVIRASCGCLPNSIERYKATQAVIASSVGKPGTKVLSSCLAEIEKLAIPGEITRDMLEAGTNLLYKGLEGIRSEAYDEWSFLSAILTFTAEPGQHPETLLFWEQAAAVTAAFLAAGNPFGPVVLQTGEKARIMFQEARLLYQNRSRFQLLEESVRFQNIIELLLLTRDMPDLYSVLTQIAPVLDIKNFFLVIHKPVKNRVDNILPPIPADRTLVLAIHDGAPMEITKPAVDSPLLLPQAVMDSLQGRQLIVAAVFYREELYGYVCLEPGSFSMSLYDNLILELGSIIKRCFLDAQQKKTENKLRVALQKLKESNLKLADLSLTDELTRLYNRRGFIDMATHSLVFARRMKKDALLIFIDLDGLKKINDTWGHAAGDDAIKGASLVIKATFRQVDILCRLGGDEFIILTLDSPNATREIILERLQNNVITYNQSNANPWDLSMSIGVLPVTPDEKRPLEELMHLADELQYQEKVARRKNRV